MASSARAEKAAVETAPRLRGTWGTVLLPIRGDDTIDFGALDEELSVLLAAGLAGLYTCGTAGEFYTLDEGEFDRLNELVARRCDDQGVRFQIGASHMSGQVCLSRIARARDLGPCAVQVILPDWLPLSWPEARRALERMAEVADPAPLVLYNPPHAKTVLRPGQLADLASDVPALVGVKVAGTEGFYRAIRDAAPGLAVFVPGHELSRARPLGVAGSYSNVACLQPAGAAGWQRQMEADPASGAELGERVRMFFERYMAPLGAQGYCNTALDKALSAIGAWAPVGTRARWPYAAVPDHVVEDLKPQARSSLPELFEWGAK